MPTLHLFTFRNHSSRTLLIALLLLVIGADIALLVHSRPVALNSPRLPLRMTSVVYSPTVMLPQKSSVAAQPAAAQSGTNVAIAELKRRGLYISLQQAMQSALYRIEPEHGRSGEYTADNLAQRYSVQFGAEGVKVQPGSKEPTALSLNLRLAAIEEDGHPVSLASVRLHAKGERIEYDRGNVQEWYANTPQGLEQGFTVVHPPVSGKPGKLQLRLAVCGGWQGHLSQDGQWIDLQSGNHHSRLRYGKLQAQDARGRVLGSHLRLAGQEIALEVDTRQAVYPIRIDPLIVGSGDELTASDRAEEDLFGGSVSLDGNTALIGATSRPTDTNAPGKAYVFVRHGYVWSQQAKLTASDATSGDNFGQSVSVSGNTAVIGAPDHASNGAAYVFIRNEGSWSQQTELTASDGASDDGFGQSVSVSGNTALVGAPGKASGDGAAYIFTSSGGTWTQQTELSASDASSGDGVGFAVSVSGNTALVGAPGHAGNGAAYVFASSGGTWAQQAELTANDATFEDGFGISVSLSGNIALVGSPFHSSNGAAYVFIQNGGSWTQQTELNASDGAPLDQFGFAVSLSGNTALIGAPQKTFGAANGVGAAYVFTSSGVAWGQQQELTESNGASGDDFGRSVSISGNLALVGADEKDSELGAAYVFPLGPELNASDGAQDDRLGFAVSLSGNTALVGAPHQAGNGAAYVFVQNSGSWTQQAKLTASDGITGTNYFGISVSLSGNTALIGAEGKSDLSGAAYIFVSNGGIWTQQAELTLNQGSPGDNFGNSVSIGGNTALVGAPGVAGTGAAYVFVNSSGTWVQQQELTASDAALGNAFGYSVSVSKDTILVGAPNHADNGAVYVFVRSGNTWTQQAELTANDGVSGDSFGNAVSLSGDTILVGAPYKAKLVGAAYVFVNSGGTWAQQQELTASDAAQGDYFGNAVSISGNTALIGAYGVAGTGAAYVFVNSSGTWAQQQELAASDSAQFNVFGSAVSISGDTLLVGAFGTANNTGAVYTLSQSPVATNDSYVAYVNTPLSVANAEGVLANDTDPSALSLSTQLAVFPANGSLSLNSDGSFVYTPNTDFSGTDTFAYQATDGFDISDLAWVTITVLSPIPPVISDLDPTEGAAGGPQMVVWVNGMDFTTGSVVSVNNTPVATFFISDMQLLALVPSSFLSTPTTLSVQVNNPQPNGASNSVDLPVVNFLDSVSTGTFVIGGSPATLTIRLNTPAPLSRLTLALSSNQPGVVQFVDSSNNPISQITFTTGQQTVQIKVNTTAVSQQTSVQLQASVGGTSKSATLLVLPQQQTGVSVIKKPGVGPPLHSPALPK